MIAAYAKLILEDDTFSFENVPQRYQARVREYLLEQGYDERGNKIDSGK